MKLILAIINNDDAASVAASLTEAGFTITKLSTTGGFLQAGNTTLLIGAEESDVQRACDIIRRESFTRTKKVPTNASFGRGLAPGDRQVETQVNGATVFVLNVDSFEKM